MMHLWPHILFFSLILNRGRERGSGDQLLHPLCRRERGSTGIQEWGRERVKNESERERKRERERPVIKPSSVPSGGALFAKPGFGSEPGGR